MDPLFPGMANTVGALLPGLVSLAIVIARRARSGLGLADQVWLVALSLALTSVLCRVTMTPDETTLHLVPGATVLLCYLVWCGRAVSPGLAFALTYATILPVDFFGARLATGADFNSECIGGGGWCDGLLILPALTALAVMYANWRTRKAGRARVFGFERCTRGSAHLNAIAEASSSASAMMMRQTPFPASPKFLARAPILRRIWGQLPPDRALPPAWPGRKGARRTSSMMEDETWLERPREAGAKRPTLRSARR